MAFNELLPRLMATENLKIQHAKVSTASFNLKDRILMLPIFAADLDPNVYELFVGHEVGHALETPLEGWHNAVVPEFTQTLPNKGRGFKSYLNVIEDARIERLIKNRYPGLRKQFFTGYFHLFKNDFFGPAAKSPSALLLIDRINLYYKVGALTMVTFTAEEREFLKRIDAALTFEDVKNISVDVYRYCAEENTKKDQIEASTSVGTPTEGEGEGAGADGEDFGDDDGDEGEDSKGKKVSEKNSENPEEGRTGAGDIGSVTDYSFSNNIKTLNANNLGAAKYIAIEPANINDHVIPAATVLKEYEINWYKTPDHQGLHKKFLAKNNQYISHLAKEFELRKNARAVAKAKQSKTGALDNAKLYSYKFNDELFKSITTVPNGKNHGLVIIIDWSSSMTENLAATLEQSLILVHFCKKVNIPFRVYCFMSGYSATPISGISREEFEVRYEEEYYKKDVLTYTYQSQLAELLSDSMPRSMFAAMSNKLYETIAAYTRPTEKNIYRTGMSGHLTKTMTLSGTPLHQSILLSRYIIEDFRKSKKLDIVNTIFLSDGDGNTLSSNRKTEHNAVFTDSVTKKSIKAGKSWRARGQMIDLVNLVRDITGSKFIGFYICDCRLRSILSLVDDKNKAKDVKVLITKENYAAIDDMGFDEYYVIPGGNVLTIQSDELDIPAGQTKSKILSAVKKNQARKNYSRVMLNRFIRSIA